MTGVRLRIYVFYLSSCTEQISSDGISKSPGLVVVEVFYLFALRGSPDFGHIAF